MFTRIKHVASQISFSADSIMMALLGILVVLGPVFFIPVKGFAVMSSKGFFVFIIGAVALLVYGVGILRKGVITLPRKPIFIVLSLIVITGFIGALLSQGFKMSFLGYGFETTTWLFMALFALTTFFAYQTIRSYERLGMLYGGMIVAFIVLALFHVLRFIIGPAFGNMGVLGSATATLIGSWGDLAVFCGFITLFAVTTLELAGLKKSFKWIVGSIGAIALVLLLFMNIGIVWIILGLVSLIFALYLFSFAYWDAEAKSYRKEHRTPWFVLALFTVSVLAIFFGGMINSLANRHQNITWNEVRPSVGMTFRVAEKSLVHNFATGYGPHSFGQVWSLVKPAALSGQAMGNTSFVQGFGYIPTQIAANGIVGAILWISLFVFLVITLIQKTRQGFVNALDRYFSILMGTGILYLSIVAWIYIPGTYALILLAVLIGMFLGLSPSEKSRPDRTFSFIKDPRASFFGIFAISLLIIVTLVGGYVAIRKTSSFAHYARGLTLLNKNDFKGANREVTLAASLASHDLYQQQLAHFALSDVTQISSLLSSGNKDVITKQIEQTLGVALGHAQAAVDQNPTDYKNWLLLGNVYRSIVLVGVPDAYTRATEAYQEAQRRAPHDVTLQLSFAQLEVANKNIDKAMSLIKESINTFPTSEAYILRAQIQLSQQKYDDAIDSVKAAVGLNPYNADLAYQYGLLLFSQKQYQNAIPVFGQTIVVDQTYANAYVYLGVAYERVGDMVNANKVYEYIRKQFTGGADAIERVRSGTTEAPDPAVPDPTQSSSTKSTKTSPSSSSKTPVAPTTKKQ